MKSMHLDSCQQPGCERGLTIFKPLLTRGLLTHFPKFIKNLFARARLIRLFFALRVCAIILFLFISRKKRREIG